MNKFFPTLLFSCALAIPAALSAGTFEGKLHMRVTSTKSTDGPQELDMRIKDDFVRIDPQTKDKSGKAPTVGGIIIDGKKSEVTILMTENQMYMVTSIKGQGSPEARPATTAPSHETGDKNLGPALEKTGEHEKILGYDTEKFVMKEKGGSHTMWLTSELGTFMGLSAGGGAFGGSRRGGNSQQAQAWEEALKGKSVFPLRVVGADTTGKETDRMEVTAVEKQSLPDSDFAPPAGYKRFEIPNVSDMMKNMGR